MYERVAYEDMMMRRYNLPHPDRIKDLPWYFLSRIDGVTAAVREAQQRRG